VNLRLIRRFAPFALLAALASAVTAAETGKLEVRNATGKIELTADDLRPIKFDESGPVVTTLAILSDGKQVTFKATLKEVPNSARGVLNIYLDTDNNPATGMQLSGRNPGASSTRRVSMPASITAAQPRPVSVVRAGSQPDIGRESS